MLEGPQPITLFELWAGGEYLKCVASTPAMFGGLEPGDVIVPRAWLPVDDGEVYNRVEAE